MGEKMLFSVMEMGSFQALHFLKELAVALGANKINHQDRSVHELAGMFKCAVSFLKTF